MKTLPFAALALLVLFLTAPPSIAGPVSTKSVMQQPVDPFARGNNELEFLLGGYWGFPSTDTPKRPDYSFGLAHLRYGWMLNDPTGNGLLRGNWEFLIGAFGGPTFSGPGDYHIGADLNLRYNFIQPGAKVIPYFQISAGGVYSDVADDDALQDYLGTDWNFSLGANIGVRWMLSDRCALVTSFDWVHFSNAGASERNRSYNGLGGSIGLSWLLY
jgi:hypothetical protein